MVYRQAARKTVAYMVISGVLSLGIVTYLSEPLTGSPTAHAVTATDVLGSSWLVFVLGIFIGTLMIGTYFYLMRVEADRDE